MARLWRDQGKRDEARELLAPVYGSFTEGFDTDTACTRCLLQFIQLRAARSAYDVDIDKDSHQAQPWHCFDQDVLSFAVVFTREDADASRIALWPR